MISLHYATTAPCFARLFAVLQQRITFDYKISAAELGAAQLPHTRQIFVKRLPSGGAKSRIDSIMPTCSAWAAVRCKSE